MLRASFASEKQCLLWITTKNIIIGQPTKSTNEKQWAGFMKIRYPLVTSPGAKLVKMANLKNANNHRTKWAIYIVYI